jgi:hypothetical protein
VAGSAHARQGRWARACGGPSTSRPRRHGSRLSRARTRGDSRDGQLTARPGRPPGRSAPRPGGRRALGGDAGPMRCRPAVGGSQTPSTTPASIHRTSPIIAHPFRAEAPTPARSFWLIASADLHRQPGQPPFGEPVGQAAGRNPLARRIVRASGRTRSTGPRLFDTAWWSPANLLALLTLVPPGQLLFGSDAPTAPPPRRPSPSAAPCTPAWPPSRSPPSRAASCDGCSPATIGSTSAHRRPNQRRQPAAAGARLRPARRRARTDDARPPRRRAARARPPRLPGRPRHPCGLTPGLDRRAAGPPRPLRTKRRPARRTPAAPGSTWSPSPQPSPAPQPRPCHRRPATRGKQQQRLNQREPARLPAAGCEQSATIRRARPLGRHARPSRNRHRPGHRGTPMRLHVQADPQG